MYCPEHKPVLLPACGATPLTCIPAQAVTLCHSVSLPSTPAPAHAFTHLLLQELESPPHLSLSEQALMQQIFQQ